MLTLTPKEHLYSTLNLLPTAIYDSFPAVLFGRALVLACRLGIFESLSRRSQSPAGLAESLQLHPKGAEILLPALCAGGYLKKSGEKYHLAPQAKKWLVRSSPQYIGNFLAYIELLHSHWSYLDQTLKQGKPPQTYVEMFTEKEWEIYTLGMMDLAKLIIPHLLPTVRLPRNAQALLDVGGSHGLYSIELLKRNPSLNATIADLPQALRTTERIVADHGLTDRIRLLPCDITNNSFEPQHFDVVLAFNIIHGFDHQTNRKLFDRIVLSLRNGGIIYILDQLMDDHARGLGKFLPLMVGLNLLNEIGGTAYSFDQIESVCRAAGLENVKRFQLSLPGVVLVRAWKR